MTPSRQHLDVTSTAMTSTWTGQLAARPADALAVVDHTTSWTTAELLARAAAADTWLDSIGAAPGVPVPAIVWASPPALALVVAGALSGRPIAPLGPLLTARELVACLRSTGGQVVVVDEASSAIGSTVAAEAGLPLASLPLLHDAGDGVPTGAHPAREPLAPRPGDVAVVLHTSGTGGVPKRVDARQGPLAARTAVVGSLLRLGPGDRYVTAKGIHHIGGLGLTLAALTAGAAVIPFPRYSAETWSALAPLAPTHGSVVPAMIEDMLGAGTLRLPSMRLLQYGGAPIRPETLAALLVQEPGLDVVALYGQTEGSPLASLSPEDHRLAVRGRGGGRPDLLRSAGRAAPGVELRIEAGEVWARAAHLFRVGDDGWLHTGDLGHLDGDGHLFLTGRAGDVIVRGGENVHPLEVEQVLAAHPSVADVAVAGVPDDRLGETVGAWIVPAGPDGIDEVALRAWARERLAGFKVPTVWRLVESLPRNPNGKIVRRALPDP